MKKIYLCVLGFGMIAGNNVYAQLPGFLDPIKEPAWDVSFLSDPLSVKLLKSGQLIQEEKINGNWRNLSKFIGIQDAQGNQLKFEQAQWDTVANVWGLASEFNQTFTYNSQNKVTNRHTQFKNEGEDFMLSTFNYTYDGSGKYLPVTGIDSINQGGTWFSFGTLDSIVYNSNGKISDRIKSRNLMGTKTPSEKMSFTYNSNGNLSQTMTYRYNNDVWENDQRYTYGYDANNHLTTHFLESYSTNKWEGDAADTFTYNGNNMIRKIHYNNDNNGPVPSDNYEYIYTGSEVSEMIDNEWINNQWTRVERNVITYNNGKINNVLVYKWTNNAYETDYYKRMTSAPLGVSNFAKTETLVVYPNPANETISISGNLNSNTLVSIYNIAGVLVKTESLNNNSINVENLTNGIYFLTLTNEGKTVRQKFVKN